MSSIRSASAAICCSPASRLLSTAAPISSATRFLQRYVAAWSAVGDALPELLEHYAVAWTLLEPLSPAASLLDHLPGWERIYTDPTP